jgi:hypothetical protein
MKGFYKLGLLRRKVGRGLLYTLARIINSTPSQYNIIYCIVLLLATLIKTLPLSIFLYLRAGLSSVTPRNQLTSLLGSLLSGALAPTNLSTKITPLTSPRTLDLSANLDHLGEYNDPILIPLLLFGHLQNITKP